MLFMAHKRRFSLETKGVRSHTKDVKMCARNACLIFNSVDVKYSFFPLSLSFSYEIFMTETRIKYEKAAKDGKLKVFK